MNPVLALISLLLLVVAAVFAVFGWLLNLDDREDRTEFRVYAWMCLFGMFSLNWIRDLDHHSWFWLAVDVVALLYGMDRIRHHWRVVEALRELKRITVDWVPLSERYPEHFKKDQG